MNNESKTIIDSHHLPFNHGVELFNRIAYFKITSYQMSKQCQCTRHIYSPFS